jgi:P-type Cu+ transporter
MAIDPICGMTVNEESALRAKCDGQPSHFCSYRCRQEFLSTHSAVKREDKPQARAIYTCPMHPEVEQDLPGACPKCGKALEPKIAAASTDAEENV